MSSLWPWIALAGAGALHGLNPATGWLLAAGWGLRSGDWRQAMRALVPIAAGHAASVMVVAWVVALGHSIEEWKPVAIGAAVLGMLVCLLHRLPGRTKPVAPAATPIAARHISTALWSFVASTAHGSGLMLLPAFVPLCVTGSPVGRLTASGSMLLALAAVTVHAAAMLGTLSIVAAGAIGGLARARGLMQRGLGGQARAR